MYSLFAEFWVFELAMRPSYDFAQTPTGGTAETLVYRTKKAMETALRQPGSVI